MSSHFQMCHLSIYCSMSSHFQMCHLSIYCSMCVHIFRCVASPFIALRVYIFICVTSPFIALCVYIFRCVTIKDVSLLGATIVSVNLGCRSPCNEQLTVLLGELQVGYTVESYFSHRRWPDQDFNRGFGQLLVLSVLPKVTGE
jgi:hypothetical protein